MTRRIVFAPGSASILACSDCAYTIKPPKAGPFGRTTNRARASQARIAFNRHDCAHYPRTRTEKP